MATAVRACAAAPASLGEPPAQNAQCMGTKRSARRGAGRCHMLPCAPAKLLLPAAGGAFADTAPTDTLLRSTICRPAGVPPSPPRRCLPGGGTAPPGGPAAACSRLVPRCAAACFMAQDAGRAWVEGRSACGMGACRSLARSIAATPPPGLRSRCTACPLRVQSRRGQWSRSGPTPSGLRRCVHARLFCCVGCLHRPLPLPLQPAASAVGKFHGRHAVCLRCWGAEVASRGGCPRCPPPQLSS